MKIIRAQLARGSEPCNAHASSGGIASPLHFHNAKSIQQTRTGFPARSRVCRGAVAIYTNIIATFHQEQRLNNVGERIPPGFHKENGHHPLVEEQS